MKYEMLNPLITSMKGRLGKYTIYSSWKSIPIARPVYTDRPPTEAQVIVREAFNKADSAWFVLSQEQRDSWRSYSTKAHKGTNYSSFIGANITSYLATDSPTWWPPDSRS